jgi:hypothetical protein
MNALRHSILVMAIVALQGACAPAVHYAPMTGQGQDVLPERSPRDPSAPVDIFRDSREIPRSAHTVGEVRVSDTGFSMGCGYDAVLSRILDRARAEGADAVYLAQVNEPDLLSTCYRITARLLVYMSYPYQVPERYGDAPSAVSWPRPIPATDAIIRIDAGDRQPSPRSGDFARLADAVIVLEGNRGVGSGFLISKHGLALTNAHVVANQRSLVAVLHDGSRLPVRVVRTDAEADVALVEILCNAGGCHTLEVHPDLPEIGSDVRAIGTPVGLSYTLTRGIVSGFRRGPRVTLIQTDAAVNPGNSGGPLLEASGQVVGVVSSKLAAGGIEGLGFAVAIPDALRVLGVRVDP